MEIAAAVIAFLSPYLADAGKSVAGKAGDAAAAGAGALYEAIRRKFDRDKDDYAKQTLARAEEQPESEPRKLTLVEVLAEKVAADPGFASELQGLLESATGVRVRLVDEVERVDVRDAEMQNVDVQEGVGISVDASMKGKERRGDRLRAQNVTVRTKPERDARE